MSKREHNDITIDANDPSFTSEEFNIKNSSLITAYIVGDSGTHNSCQVVLQVSPNGLDWFDVGDTLTGNLGKACANINAKMARFKVVNAEGATSTYNGFIWAQ